MIGSDKFFTLDHGAKIHNSRHRVIEIEILLHKDTKSEFGLRLSKGTPLSHCWINQGKFQDSLDFHGLHHDLFEKL